MKYVIGIDEVGRGCLAGPVTVAAVALPMGYRVRGLGFRIKLRDSKKLSAKQRKEWFGWIKARPKIFYARANVYPKIIDRINISRAANLAATRALARLTTHNKQLITGDQRIFLDGGLFVDRSLVVGRKLSVRTVIRGDEKYNCVKLASIIAKVNRDRLLKQYHKKYPKYGFDRHKGYGTKAHIAAIRRFGACPLHRLTFIKNFC